MRHSLQHNALLAALPVAEHARLSDALELVPLALGQVLHEAIGLALFMGGDSTHWPMRCSYSAPH